MRSSSKSHVGPAVFVFFIIVNSFGALFLASKTTVLKRFTKDEAGLVTHLLGRNLHDHTETTVITDGILFESIYFYSHATIKPMPLMRQLHICADKKSGSSARESCLLSKAAILEARQLAIRDNVVAILKLHETAMSLGSQCFQLSQLNFKYEYFKNYLILESTPQQRSRWHDLLNIVDCLHGS
jgi:hypothetical protein